MERSIPELKAEFVCMCEREKNNRFKIHVIILRYIKNVKFPFKKDLNLQNFSPKHPFFLYFRNRPKNGEEN